MWHLVGAGAAVLTMFGFVPQIVKIVKTKSVKDVSLFTLIQFTAGVTLWMLYGLYLGDIIIVVANAVIFITLVIALILYARFLKPDK